MDIPTISLDDLWAYALGVPNGEAEEQQRQTLRSFLENPSTDIPTELLTNWIQTIASQKTATAEKEEK